MNEPEIFARLTALHSALVEKLGAQPFIEPSLSVYSGGSVCIAIYGDDAAYRRREGCIKRVKAPTIAAVIADAEAFVAAMPDPDAAKLTAWHGKLATVIDEGHALSLPDDVMTPLRQSSQAMTENLLTHAAE